MADNTDGGNVLNFPRIGFTLAPTSPAGPPPHTPAATTANQTPANPTTGSGSRSPLDIVNALPDPGPLRPLAVAPGQAPAAFRSTPAGDHDSDGSDLVGPRLGALSLAAILAVAVAALRGTHTALSDWRQRRLERAEQAAPLREARVKHQLAMQGLADKAAEQRAKTNRKVPSSAEFGRKATGNRSGGTSSGASGGGKGSSSGSGSSRKSTTSGSSGAGSAGPGRKSRGSGGSTGLSGGSGSNSRKAPKSPHRPSQGTGAGNLLTKNSPKGRNTPPGNGGSGSSGGGGGPKPKSSGASGSRTPLSAALADTAQKAAARRLKRRRKHNPATPALWKNTPNSKNNKTSQPPALPKPGQQNTAPGAAGANTKQIPARTQRTTLNQALRKTALKAAARRWKRRQTQSGATPPIWTAPRTPKKPKNAKNTTSGGGKGTGKPKPGPNRKTGKKNSRSTKANRRWARVRAYARQKAANGGCFGTGGNTGPTPPPDGWPSWDAYWQYINAQHNHRMGYDNNDGDGARRSPFETAGQAADTTYTAERADHPGTQARRWEPDALTEGTPALPSTGPAALDAAPVPHTARPGTTRPRKPVPMPPARRQPAAVITKAHKDAARTARQTVGHRMDDQHATEINLDDACKAADKLNDDAFKTHDQTHKLAGRARALRNAWLVLAKDCATNHNLIGDLFTGASIRFAESMDLVARMADEMEASSLDAAEKSETAGNEINDAYRPISQATADAGLTTPSAPVHNRT